WRGELRDGRHDVLLPPLARAGQGLDLAGRHLPRRLHRGGLPAPGDAPAVRRPAAAGRAAVTAQQDRRSRYPDIEAHAPSECEVLVDLEPLRTGDVRQPPGVVLPRS